MLPLSGEFTAFDWNTVPTEVSRGERARAISKTKTSGDVCIREVQYEPGYLADHWCRRGHVILVLQGTLITELENGAAITLTQGMSYVVPDGVTAHRSRTETGALLFIVD